MKTPLVLAAALLALAVVPPVSADEAAPTPEEHARQVVDLAKREAKDIRAQATALAKLAWPTDGQRDPLVAAYARENLVDYGKHGLTAMRDSLYRVDPRFSADIVAALIDARRQVMAGVPPDYYSALEDALWVGSEDAQRLAVPELALVGYPPVVLACIDSAIEHPGLERLVIESLPKFHDHRARFFLEDVLLHGDPSLRPLAAEALGSIGGLAMDPLRDAALSDDPAVRTVAMRALLPVSGLDELSVVYEYLRRFEGDPPDLLQAVRERGRVLETVLEDQLESESASPSWE